MPYQSGYSFANHAIPYDVSSFSFYLLPGSYACYAGYYGSVNTEDVCDIALYLQISPDRGVTYWDYPISGKQLLVDSTTGGTTTDGPLRDIARMTTIPLPAGATTTKLYYRFDWPGGRMRWKCKYTIPESAWSDATTYAAGDIAKYSNCRFRSKQGANLNHTPPAYEDDWWKRLDIGLWMTFCQNTLYEDWRNTYGADSTPPFRI